MGISIIFQLPRSVRNMMSYFPVPLRTVTALARVLGNELDEGTSVDSVRDIDLSRSESSIAIQ
jgi:hypothetical protein